MYTVFNYKSKKELKEAALLGDIPVQRYTNGGPFEEKPTSSGCFEGPHYPQPHKWYASAPVIEKDGKLVIPQGSKVK